MYFLIVTALKSRSEYVFNKFGLPGSLNFGNFAEAFHGKLKFITWFINSITITASSVLITLVISFIAAFALTFFNFKGKNLLFNVGISLMVIPPIVIIVPLFSVLNSVSLLNNLFGVIAIYTGLMVPFSFYLLKSFFSTIPKDIIEASIIDGCGVKDIMVRIILPLSKSSLVTLTVVNAIWAWNEFLISLVFLQKDTLRTVMTGLLVFKSRYDLDIPIQMAGMFVAIVPMLIIYIVGLRYFIRGMLAGAVKG